MEDQEPLENQSVLTETPTPMDTEPSDADQNQILFSSEKLSNVADQEPGKPAATPLDADGDSLLPLRDSAPSSPIKDTRSQSPLKDRVLSGAFPQHRPISQVSFVEAVLPHVAGSARLHSRGDDDDGDSPGSPRRRGGDSRHRTPDQLAGSLPQTPSAVQRSTSQVGLAQVTLPKSAARRSNVMPARDAPKVSLSATCRSRARGRSSMGSVFFEPTQSKKVVTWKEAMESRPPLKIDMDTPGPCTYSPKIKPLNETNAPAFTMRMLCATRKRVTGSRTSWEKSWFQNPEVWTTKANLYNDYPWPSPGTYERGIPLGGGGKLTPSPQNTGGCLVARRFEAFKPPEKFIYPSPNQYNKSRADRLLYQSAPASTHSLRVGGTILWGKREPTPGPGEYRDVYKKTRKHFPDFTMKKTVRDESPRNLGPFAAF